VRITEACIGCRRVDGHGRAGQCKEINTQPPAELQSDGIKFEVVRSMLSNSQEVLVEEKLRSRTAFRSTRAEGEPPARNVCNSYLVRVSTLSTHFSTLLCISTSSIFLSPCLSSTTATARAKALRVVSLSCVLV
jgi:hypothetical protein